jgi:DNA repair protein RadC
MTNKSIKYETHLLMLLVKEYDKNAIKLSEPKDAVSACNDLFSMPKEAVIVLCLDTRMKIIARDIVSVGTLTSSLLHPREIFRLAILKNAQNIIVLHNHPSGETEPSDDDIIIANRLRSAGELLGIAMTDFIIFNSKGDYFSRTNGMNYSR